MYYIIYIYIFYTDGTLQDIQRSKIKRVFSFSKVEHEALIYFLEFFSLVCKNQILCMLIFLKSNLKKKKKQSSQKTPTNQINQPMPQTQKSNRKVKLCVWNLFDGLYWEKCCYSIHLQLKRAQPDIRWIQIFKYILISSGGSLKLWLATLMPHSRNLSSTLAKTTRGARSLRGMKDILKSRKIWSSVPSEKNSSKVMKNSEILCFPASLRISRWSLDNEVPCQLVQAVQKWTCTTSDFWWL